MPSSHKQCDRQPGGIKGKSPLNSHCSSNGGSAGCAARPAPQTARSQPRRPSAVGGRFPCRSGESRGSPRDTERVTPRTTPLSPAIQVRPDTTPPNILSEGARAVRSAARPPANTAARSRGTSLDRSTRTFAKNAAASRTASVRVRGDSSAMLPTEPAGRTGAATIVDARSAQRGRPNANSHAPRALAMARPKPSQHPRGRGEAQAVTASIHNWYASGGSDRARTASTAGRCRGGFEYARCSAADKAGGDQSVRRSRLRSATATNVRGCSD